MEMKMKGYMEMSIKGDNPSFCVNLKLGSKMII